MTTSAEYRPIITGALGGHPSPESLAPNRFEFRDLVKDKRQFALYVQALEIIQSESFDDDFSWPAIGGIHGEPYVRWGDSGPPNPPGGDVYGGYCTHGSVLFPTWHRPYVSLFEQSLYVAAQKAAQRYRGPDKMEWVRAAQNFRAPFWDWARRIPSGQPAVPVEMTSETVSITTPDGEKSVQNPIRSFTFRSKYPYTTLSAPYNQWQTTLRYPNSDQANAHSQMDQFVSVYGSNNSQVRTQTYQMLTRLDNWPYFSNHTTKQNPPIANSLETIHDNMHLLIGGNGKYQGHMSDVPVAGFDVAFFLHHANVDRLFAVWQAIHPNVYVTPGDQPDGTYTIKDNGPVDERSDLTPFWNTHTTYWNSDEVRNFATKLHYSYPDFDGLVHLPPKQVRKEMLKRVAALYGPHPLPFNPGGPKIPAPAPANPGGPEQPASGTVGSESVSVTGGEYNSSTHEWTVHIRFKKFELGKSYSIQVFLGDVYVGSVSAFTSVAADRCENCRNNPEIELEGFVHLNEALLQKAGTLEPSVIVSLLQKELTVRAQGWKLDGTPADLDNDLPSRKIAPFYRLTSQSSPAEVPTLGEAIYHDNVLHGKPGYTPPERW